MKLFIASFPKSGSTYLAAIFERLPSIQRAALIDFELAVVAREDLPERFNSKKEQELSHHVLARMADKSYIGKHHVVASLYTETLIKQHGIELIVLVRNIHDCLVSLADHIGAGHYQMPYAHWPASIVDKPFDYRLDAVVDMVTPWYLKFYASWVETFPDRIVHYEDVVLGGSSRVNAMLDRLNIDFSSSEISPEDIAASVQQADGKKERFNAGKAGRGSVLNSRQIATIENYARYYEHIDFRPIGIGAED